MIGGLALHILALPAWVALLVTFALPALESSAFVGFLFPGELALILGGVMASQGRVSLFAVLATAIAGAILGDSVGYAVGKRYGRRMLDGTVGRFVKARHLDSAERYLAARGGKAVFFGRFTAALRVLIPGLAGMSGLRYRTFLVYNVASAVGWGSMSVMLGYLGGASWQHVEHVASGIGLGALAVVIAMALGGILFRRRRANGSTAPPPGTDAASHARDGRGQPPLPPTIPARAPAGSIPLVAQEPRAMTPTTPSPVRFSRTVVIMPTYNEAGNVTTALDRVRRAAPGVDILVVDDNSPDGTARLVALHPAHHAPTAASTTPEADGAGRVFLLSRAAKEGLGAAYRAGFAWALARGYDVVVQMDADLSHPADRVPALLEALSTADVAVGSRYVTGGGVSNWSLGRRLISWGGNAYVRLVLGLPVHDTTAGFKAFRRRALERIGTVASASNGYCFQVENTWRAVRLGLTVTEVPITFTDRTVGTSKMSRAIVTEALARVLVWRWHELRHQRRVLRGARTHRVAA